MSDYATCALITENSFKPSESRTLLTLKICKHTTNRLIIQSDPIIINLLSETKKMTETWIEKQNETVLVTRREKKPIPNTC